MTHLKHARTADRLSKIIAALEAERENIADAVRNDKGGARDKILCELANAAHELEQGFRAMR
mgnify:CR=1 FL=1